MESLLLTQDDASWDVQREAFNALVDQQPAAIATPQSAEDVANTIRTAAAEGKRVAAQRTGHAAAALGSLADSVLVRTTGLTGIGIDVERRRARVGAGTLWGELVPKASELGLAALHGSTPTVCISGYSLSGGVSFYGREFGLACNRVTAVELVTADGEQRRVDADHEPGLFWALRGGGGNFGMVTALEFDLLEMPERYAGALFFPVEQASEVLHGWRQWTEAAPEQATSVGRLMNFPPIPEIPDPFRGKSFAVIEVIYNGDESSGAELVAPLRGLGTPAMDTIATVPPAGIVDLHMDPPEPSPWAGTSALTRELDAAAIDAILAAVGPGSGSQLVSVEMRHCGGALSRAPEGAGALATLPGAFLLFGVGIVPVPEAMAPTQRWLAGLRDAVEPYRSGNYLNFCEDATDLETAFPAETVARLRELKRRYDPENLFHVNHAIVAG
jgi:FAD/FMN-containing dehydrogenase